MIWIIIAIFTTLILAFITVCLMVNVPKGFSKPWVFRMFVVGGKIREIWHETLDFTGVRPILSSYRHTGDQYAKPMGRPRTEGLVITDTTFDGINVRVYRPVEESKEKEGYPGLVFYHGGGWTVCDVKAYHPLMTHICQKLKLVLVSVEYRLAPECKFPGPFNDCVTATKHFLSHAERYGVNTDRIGIGGDSAGGNLAAAVALKLRDEEYKPAVKAQVLIYPVLQGIDFETPSFIQNGSGPMISRTIMPLFWSYYLAGSDKYRHILGCNNHTSKDIKKQMADSCLSHSSLGSELLYPPYHDQKTDYGSSDIWQALQDILLNPYCCPLMAKDLSKLPATFVLTCNYDVLRDEGIWYAQRLKEAGVNVTLTNMEDGFHGIFAFQKILKEGKDCFNLVIDYIRNNL